MNVEKVKSDFEANKENREEEQKLFNNILETDNVSEIISDGIPLRAFERYFGHEKFNLLTTHSDPELKGFIKQLGESKDSRFLSEAMRGSAKFLRACAKANDFNSGEPGLNIVIKALSRVKVLNSELCEKLINVIALFSNNTLSRSLTSQVVLALAKCIELNSQTSQEVLPSVVEDLILEDTDWSLTTAFSLLSLVFHINPDIGQLIFATDILQNNEINQSRFSSEKVAISALEALSAACVNKESRKSVGANFEHVITDALETTNKRSIQVLATSIMIKVKASSETNTKKEQAQEKEDMESLMSLSELLEDTVNDYSTRHEIYYYGAALEGLAYTSLISPIKRRITARNSMIKALVSIIENDIRESPWVYCALIVLANVTEYPPKLSAEQEKLNELKNYAGKSNGLDSSSSNSGETDTLVKERCKVVLDSGVTGVISQNAPRFTMASKATAGTLLRNLVTERVHRNIFAQQGGLAVLIYLLIAEGQHHQTSSLSDAKSIGIATSALAKTLISVDPTVALSNKISPVVTIKPLIEQLSIPDGVSPMPLLDIFESLLALTNLAAVDDSCRDKIVQDGFNKIETYMTHSNTLIQRADIELICNLSMSPYCAEKFLDGSGPSKSRLEILALLTDVDDRPTRMAAAGALAVLSEWAPAAKELVKVDKVLEKLFSVFNEEDFDSDVLIRASVTIRNISIGGETEVIKAKGGKDILSSSISKIKTKSNEDNSELISTITEALSAINE